MKDKNGVLSRFIFCGEVCGFSGVIRNDKDYYVPLTSNLHTTTYYRFINKKRARKVFYNDSVTPNQNELKDLHDQRYK